MRLLTLHELFFLAGTSIDLVNAADQRQDTKKGRLNPFNVHNKGKFSVWPYVGVDKTPSLGQAVRVFPSRLFLHSARPYAGLGE